MAMLQISIPKIEFDAFNTNDKTKWLCGSVGYSIPYI